ncbi:GDSL-type esterase/lipase family protein [Paenibacillus rhizosphaerae]|uniref:GDSL-type esterase/lipase family protein n=1 Tax=Paenibacillus rhizosphaerae TaxID=297318 RepID=UPI0028AE6BE7|nr:GDSL-type esterase/lipase family protein [Paenibacillus rhizosphaerae]
MFMYITFTETTVQIDLWRDYVLSSSKWIWRIIGILSIAATLLLIAGFAYAVQDINHPQGSKLNLSAPSAKPEGTAPGNIEQKKELKAAVIGDSLAKGTGDSTGSGFARRSVTKLAEATGKKVTLLNNLGINGLTTSGLLPKLKEQGTRYVLGEADIILLSIGGNDLFQGADLLSGSQTGTAVNDGEAADLDPDELLEALPEAKKQLQHILEQIRKINPGALIIYVGLYNPFEDVQDLKVVGNQAVSEWNSAALTVINKYDNMTLVPTFDLFQHNLNKYLSTDHFHPNDQGYERIAERIVQGML